MRFEQAVASVYNGGPFSLEDVIAVFAYFFDAYRENRGAPHPSMTLEQIRQIVYIMPTLEDGTELEPSDYPPMIRGYFRTKFRRSDYKIFHFFSGRIRDLRFYESVY